jgi:hypothetical protein
MVIYIKCLGANSSLIWISEICQACHVLSFEIYWRWKLFQHIIFHEGQTMQSYNHPYKPMCKNVVTDFYNMDIFWE